MQELITYLIIALVLVVVIYRTVKSLKRFYCREPKSACGDCTKDCAVRRK
ncbi:MAG: hypothetical protein ACK5LR_05510 [Mangrovibacterium sp.]